MTEEKFRRLSDTSELTDDDLAGFIQRQLVETSQAVCGLAEVLELYLPNTIIIYNKASNTSDFRKRFHIPKVRGLNDAHHAVDAYLNVITGRIMYYMPTFVMIRNNSRIICQRYTIGTFTTVMS